MAKAGKEAEASIDTNKDRYPTVEKVFAKVVQRLDQPKAPIERVEVTCLASGEATYRVWLARAEEPDAGYLPAGEI